MSCENIPLCFPPLFNRWRHGTQRLLNNPSGGRISEPVTGCCFLEIGSQVKGAVRTGCLTTPSVQGDGQCYTANGGACPAKWPAVGHSTGFIYLRTQPPSHTSVTTYGNHCHRKREVLLVVCYDTVRFVKFIIIVFQFKQNEPLLSLLQVKLT